MNEVFKSYFIIFLTTHSKLTEDERQAVGITPGLVRIAVGLESAEDIIEDVEQALGG